MLNSFYGPGKEFNHLIKTFRKRIRKYKDKHSKQVSKKESSNSNSNNAKKERRKCTKEHVSHIQSFANSFVHLLMPVRRHTHTRENVCVCVYALCIYADSEEMGSCQ